MSSKNPHLKLKLGVDYLMNELLWGLLVLVNFVLIVLAYKKWGVVGLYAWIGVALVIANIQVLKTIQIFGITATLGNIIYGTTFLATDILSESHGKEKAKTAVWIGFYMMISSTLIMWICLHFIPDSSDFVQGSLETIFSIMPRITIASLSAYLLSNFHDVWAFHKWKKVFSNRKHLWIRNNLSTMVSQLIDSVIFCFIAFWGVYELGVFFEILITTYLIKWLVSALDTPFVYFATKE